MHSPADLEVAASPPRMRRCSIASVTVAYNGASVLWRHLDSLRRQTRRLDEIIVVDNASTDDTLRLLAREYPEVTVMRLPENVGIGGGLAVGLTYAACKKNHKWVWTFDQDSVPSDNALERLLAGIPFLGEKAESTAVLAPVCANSATKTIYPALAWRGGRFVPVSYSFDQPITFVDMVISSGSLMRSGAIAVAGVPRGDFFMDFVDYEHCLRFRHRGFRIAVVHDSTLDHAIGNPTTFRLLGRSKSWADHPPWREYYMARNEIFTIWTYRPKPITKAFVFYRLLQHALNILLFGKRKFSCLQMMWRGFVDGLAGRLGPRFLPGGSKTRSFEGCLRPLREESHDEIRPTLEGVDGD